MKVGVTTFGADGGKSGISQYLINLLREFDRVDNGWEFEVLTYEDERDLFLGAQSKMPSLLVSSRLRHPLLNIAWHQAALPRTCRKRRLDVLFLPAGNRRAPLWSPCPTVGTIHDFSSIHVSEKYDMGRMAYIKQVLPLLARRFTKVLTVSESSKMDIVEFARVPEERVVVTPLAASTELYFPADKEAAADRVGAKYGVRSPYILYISRIEHPGKNHLRLIRAFERLKAQEHLPHQLVLVGSDWLRAAEVHHAAAQSKWARDIVFTGFTPTADLPDFYRGADVFVFPSLYEGFGLPILEAMSCATAVACSNVSSLPEVAGAAAIQFDPFQEEDICDALRRLLTNAEIRRDYAARGFQRSQTFSWSATARLTLDVIQSVR